jgi:hypothetical protein
LFGGEFSGQRPTEFGTPRRLQVFIDHAERQAQGAGDLGLREVGGSEPQNFFNLMHREWTSRHNFKLLF